MVEPGEIVGYGGAFRATAPTPVATIAAGYADGLIRAIGDRAAAFHKGRRLPFIGRVSMDLVTLDVSAAPDLAPGDKVDLLGSDQGVDALAAAAGTIGYEILTSLGTRYARRYVGADAD
jgi:alanine racemase